MSDAFTDETTGPEYGSLKTLTVLTFIGSAFGVIGGGWQFFQADKAQWNKIATKLHISLD